MAELTLELAICATSSDVDDVVNKLRARFLTDVPPPETEVPEVDSDEVVPDADPEDVDAPWRALAAPGLGVITEGGGSSSSAVPAAHWLASASTPQPEPPSQASSSVLAEGQHALEGPINLEHIVPPVYKPGNRELVDETGNPAHTIAEQSLRS